MLVKEWNELPKFMQVEEVKPYYKVLRKKKGQLILKRIFDICASLVLIVLLSPIILFFSILNTDIKTSPPKFVHKKTQKILICVSKSIILFLLILIQCY